MQIQGVIFDLDGTVVDSISVTKTAFKAARDYYQDSSLASVEDFLSLSGTPLRDVCKKLLLPDSFPERYLHNSQRLRPTIVMFPGVLDTIKVLQESGIPMAILTGKDRKGAREILANLQISSFFQFVITPDDEHPSKPQPDAAIWIVNQFRIEKKGCLMIGDSPLDIKCGLLSGMKTIGCTWGVASQFQLEQAGAHKVVHTPEELLNIVVGSISELC